LWTLLQVDQQPITALDTITAAIKGWVVTLDAALAGIAADGARTRAMLLPRPLLDLDHIAAWLSKYDIL
jgi:hypothetical protein